MWLVLFVLKKINDSTIKIMIIETIGTIIWSSILSITSIFSSLIIFSWTTLIILILPLLLTSILFIYYWPLIQTNWKRLQQVNQLPGPKCTSIVLGNIPYDLLWNSLFNLTDYKLVIISKFIFNQITATTKINLSFI